MRIVTTRPDDDRRAEAQRLLDAHGDGALDVIIGDMTTCLALGDTDKVIHGFAILQQCEEIRTGVPYRAEDEGLTDDHG